MVSSSAAFHNKTACRQTLVPLAFNLPFARQSHFHAGSRSRALALRGGSLPHAFPTGFPCFSHGVPPFLPQPFPRRPCPAWGAARAEISHRLSTRFSVHTTVDFHKFSTGAWGWWQAAIGKPFWRFKEAAAGAPSPPKALLRKPFRLSPHVCLLGRLQESASAQAAQGFRPRRFPTRFPRVFLARALFSTSADPPLPKRPASAMIAAKGESA